VDATAALQDQGSAQDAERTEALLGQPIEESERTDEDVQIAHFDVVDATGKYTDELDAFSSFIHIEQGYAELMKYMHDAHDSLSFFVGGDNIIAVCPALTEADYADAIDHVREAAGVDLRVGVGHGVSPRRGDGRETRPRGRPRGAVRRRDSGRAVVLSPWAGVFGQLQRDFEKL